MTGLKDEVDYVKEDREDLVARLTSAQAFGNFLLKAYDALLHYGINYKLLPEWVNGNATLDDARKLKPHAAQWTIINWIVTMENALKAAIRRKQFVLHDNKPPKA